MPTFKLQNSVYVTDWNFRLSPCPALASEWCHFMCTGN